MQVAKFNKHVQLHNITSHNMLKSRIDGKNHASKSSALEYRPVSIKFVKTRGFSSCDGLFCCEGAECGVVAHFASFGVPELGGTPPETIQY
jgi:hypothetical protein